MFSTTTTVPTQATSLRRQNNKQSCAIHMTSRTAAQATPSHILYCNAEYLPVAGLKETSSYTLAKLAMVLAGESRAGV